MTRAIAIREGRHLVRDDVVVYFTNDGMSLCLSSIQLRW